jgi:hypothetical protein
MADKAKKIHLDEKRFGVVAVEQGFITRDQLFEALKAQVDEDLDWGRHRRLGEILHQQGVMTREQIDKVLETLGVLERFFGPED